MALWNVPFKSQKLPPQTIQRACTCLQALLERLTTGRQDFSYPRLLNCTCPHPFPLKPLAAGTPQEAMDQLFWGLDWCQYTCSHSLTEKWSRCGHWGLCYSRISTLWCRTWRCVSDAMAQPRVMQQLIHPRDRGTGGSQWTDTPCALLLSPGSASSAIPGKETTPAQSGSKIKAWTRFPEQASSLLNSSNPSCMTIIQLLNLCLAQDGRIQRKYQVFLRTLLRGLDQFLYHMMEQLHKENKGTKCFICIF